MENHLLKNFIFLNHYHLFMEKHRSVINNSWKLEQTELCVWVSSAVSGGFSVPTLFIVLFKTLHPICLAQS